VGGDYRLTQSSPPRSTATPQHRNTTLLGIDSDVTHDFHVFSEYRVRDATDGREAHADMALIDGRWVAGNAQFASVRVTRDLGERFDVGLAADVMKLVPTSPSRCRRSSRRSTHAARWAPPSIHRACG
jgi:hypothetical protein